MKKLFLVLLFTVLSVTGCNAEIKNEDTASEVTTVVMTIGDPNMTLNNNEVEIDPGFGTAPVIVNGRSIVPVRAVIEKMGGRIEWNSDTQTILIYKGNDIIELKINSEIAYLNGEKYVLDTPPVIINSRIFLPLRFISEGFGFNVDWNESLQQITITDNKVTNEAVSEENIVSETQEQEDNMININLKIGNKDFSAKLYDNETTHQLIDDFPVTYDMSELHGNEKYYYMSDSLPTNSEVPYNINKGEIMLYGDDCLVVFYDTFPNSYSYTRLGYIEDTTGLEETLGKGGVSIGFEVVK